MAPQQAQRPTKLSQLLALMEAGQWPEALAFAAKFPDLGKHDTAIHRAHNAYLRPHFYTQLKKNPAQLIEEGIEALKERYLR